MSNDAANTRRALSALVSPVDAKITMRKDPAKPYVGLENIPSRGARLLGWELASSSISTNCVFRAGDVLFGKLRPNLRKCIVAPFDGYCSTDILVLRANEGVDPSFAGKVLRTEHIGEAAEMTSVGTKMPRTSWKHLRELEIFCPGLPEQSRIAQILDTLDTTIHETETIIAKLKAVKQGLLHDLLTRGINANGELRPPQSEAPHLYKESPLGWIPKDWDLSTVGEQFEIQLGKMLDGQKNAGVLKPYLGNKAVQWDRVDLVEVQQVRLSKSDLIRFRLQKGDLLVCEGGDVGRAAIWDDDLDECYYQKALHRLRPMRGYHPRLMLEILHYLMARDALSEYISRTSIAHLTQEKLAAVPLPTPKVDEQKRMVTEILTAKQRLESEESQLQKLRLLKSGLMDDLLTGRVRVTPLLADTAQQQGSE